MANTAPTKPIHRSQVRLLPAVIGVSLILIALKASGLSFPARAATDAAVPAPTAAPNQTTAPKPASAPLASINSALPMPPKANTQAGGASERPADDLPLDLAGTGVSSAEMDVLTSLSDRRDALDERERQLDLKANLIAATEKRVDDKILQLKDLQTKIEALLGQRDQMEATQLDNLVKVYSAMKPKDAARIFAPLDDQVRLSVAGRMKAADIANIMSFLPPDVAQKLTVELAGRYALSRNSATTVASAATPAAGAQAAAATQATAPAPATPSAPANSSAPAAATPATTAAPAAAATNAAKPGG